MDQKLTTQTLWQDFDPQAEALDVNVARVTGEEIVTKNIYFTGRTLQDGCKSRVYATVCYKSTKSVKPAVLFIGDYHKPIQVDVLQHLASQGFVAMSIDYAGRAPGKACTLYSPQLDYCNADVAKSMFVIETNAKETKMYEYALNSMRAITYLLENENVKNVSVFTNGSGANVGLMVLGEDKRLFRGVVAFGNLHKDFPSDEDEQLNLDSMEGLEKHLAFKEKEQQWNQGLAPQTYVQKIEIPVYVVGAATSHHVDIIKLSEMSFRLGEGSRLLLLPTVIDYVPGSNVVDVVKWLKGAEVTDDTEITSFTEDGNYYLRVRTSTSLRKTQLWYTTQVQSLAKHWVRADLVKSDDGYVAKLDLYTKQSEILAFATLDEAVNYSTPIFKDNATVSVAKIPNNVLFVGNVDQPLIPINTGDKWWNLDLQPQLASGYLDIVGSKGCAFGTFALADSSTQSSLSLTISFDVCCDIRQQVCVTLVSNFGKESQQYRQTAELVGDGKWQRVTLEGKNFRRIGDGRQISEEERVEMMIVHAEGEFIINNIYLV